MMNRSSSSAVLLDSLPSTPTLRGQSNVRAGDSHMGRLPYSQLLFMRPQVLDATRVSRQP